MSWLCCQQRRELQPSPTRPRRPLPAGALASSLQYYRANTLPARFAALQPAPVTPQTQVRVPTLGVWSSGDGALLEPQMLASRAFMAPGAAWRYERLEGVRHFMVQEAPDRVAAVVLAFLADTEADALCSKL